MGSHADLRREDSMKVRVAYTVDVDDHYRRAINDYYGRPGLASREEVVQWLKNYGDSMDMDMFVEGEDDVGW